MDRLAASGAKFTQETMKFIEANQAKPFCAVLAHYAVHTPIKAKKHLTKRFEQKLAAMPKAELEWEKESAGENLLVQNNATYAAMIESVDNGIGRLLGQLKKLGIEDNTIIVLASDHGGLSACGGNRGVATSNRPLRADELTADRDQLLAKLNAWRSEVGASMVEKVKKKK